ncbi:GntR family transcriptional regulator [Aquibacillus salsiterrae]|uniref:GntR family transcriptional regulator n=1 Tax=Aquibacillus salsiterrae TaxID=2950439 RepID=A0A9X4AEJ8_9BACI|nr:GntR family transcriptional regulator [Aquibacillus salsiterrae]MDC3416876.1 GntR family transcriptional regulator [Aquibacillus salsiterrae]
MTTKYKAIKQAIKSKILDGTYAPNQKLHSESEMIKEFGVSRHTVRLAIGELANEGWLYKIQGSGTFCADRSKVMKLNPSQKNIAIVTTFISDYIFPTIIRGAESFLSQESYNVSIFNTKNDYDQEKRVLETILMGNYDGVIVEPTRSASASPNLHLYLTLEKENIPFIMINAYYEELEPPAVVVNDEQGGYIQTEHLIKLGHRDMIGIYKTDDMQGLKRLKGYIKAHRAYGIPLNPQNIILFKTCNQEEKPKEQLEALLSNSQQLPTGLVCYNDELVLQLLDIVREKGIQVPRDLSIVGYDDSNLAEASEVKLTSVCHPKTELGVEAAKLLLNIIKDKSGSLNKQHQSIVFEPKLIERTSTRQIGAAQERVNHDLIGSGKG